LKSESFRMNLTSAGDFGEPEPQLPEPFFKSKYQLPASDPKHKLGRIINAVKAARLVQRKKSRPWLLSLNYIVMRRALFGALKIRAKSGCRLREDAQKSERRLQV
jgi:hypothetical protein